MLVNEISMTQFLYLGEWRVGGLIPSLVLGISQNTLKVHPTYIPYSWKYWRSLNLAVLPQMPFLTPFADLNLAVSCIAICTCTRKNIGGF